MEQEVVEPEHVAAAVAVLKLHDRHCGVPVQCGSSPLSGVFSCVLARNVQASLLCVPTLGFALA